jgi:hypothetical protein
VNIGTSRLGRIHFSPSCRHPDGVSPRCSIGMPIWLTSGLCRRRGSRAVRRRALQAPRFHPRRGASRDRASRSGSTRSRQHTFARHRRSQFGFRRDAERATPHQCGRRRDGSEERHCEQRLATGRSRAVNVSRPCRVAARGRAAVVFTVRDKRCARATVSPTPGSKQCDTGLSHKMHEASVHAAKGT